MAAFVFMCVTFVGAIALLAYSFRVREASTGLPVVRKKRLYRTGSFALLVLTIVVLGSSTITTVDTKNVGVVTTFGRPSGYLSNGLHFIAPWQDVTELPNAIETDTYASDGGADGKEQSGAEGTCVNVRIARQATACVNVSIRWQIQQSGVDYLFRNYHNNDAIRDNLVLRSLQEAMNQSFISYDPLGIDANGNSTNEPLSAARGKNLSDDVLALVRGDLRSNAQGAVVIRSVIIPLLNFDSDTQSRINEVQQQVALTRVAQQSQRTALEQAKANRAIAASVANNPAVLESQCLTLVRDAVNKNRSLPAGFNCFGMTNTTLALPSK